MVSRPSRGTIVVGLPRNAAAIAEAIWVCETDSPCLYRRCNVTISGRFSWIGVIEVESIISNLKKMSQPLIDLIITALRRFIGEAVELLISRLNDLIAQLKAHLRMA